MTRPRRRHTWRPRSDKSPEECLEELIEEELRGRPSPDALAKTWFRDSSPGVYRLASKEHKKFLYSRLSKSLRRNYDDIKQSLDDEGGLDLNRRELLALWNQGCYNPIRHLTDEFGIHQCTVRQDRLSCLRAIERWKRHRPVVQSIATKLPPELAYRIFEFLVDDTQPRLHLEQKRSLASAARSLVGEDSPSIQALQPIAEKALIYRTLITLDVSFQGGRADKIAVLPAFVPVLQLTYPIKHFELSLGVEMPYQRPSYPAAFLSATAGLPSLLSQLPDLTTLHLILTIDLHTTPSAPPGLDSDGPMDRACRKGFSGMTTIGQVIAELLDAARAKERGPRVLFQLCYSASINSDNNSDSENPIIPEYLIDTFGRPALEVVDEASNRSKWWQDRTPAVAEDTEQETVVEEIIDDKIIEGERNYYVKWQGWNGDFNTWEPEHRLANARAKIDAYHEANGQGSE